MAFPPIVLLAFLWIGVQVLFMLYLEAVLKANRPGLPASEYLARVLSAPSLAWPTLVFGLAVVNILFVVMIWLKARALRPRAQAARVAGMLTYGGTAILLLLLQWQWLRIVKLVT